MDIKIFLGTHKKFTPPEDDTIYTPIHSGAALREDIGYLGDNTGDNISDKVFTLYDICSTYWVWKNISCEYLGLGSYRRIMGKPCLAVHGTIGATWTDGILDREDMTYYLSHYDMIISHATGLGGKTIKEQYDFYHIIEHLELIGELINKLYPEYTSTFSIFLEKTWMYYSFNYIAKKEIFDQCFEFSYTIISEFERINGHPDYGSEYANRYTAFLSERLAALWLLHNEHKFKMIFVPIVFGDESTSYTPYEEFEIKEYQIEAGENIRDMASIMFNGEKVYLGSVSDVQDDVDYLLKQITTTTIRAFPYLIIFGLGTGNYFSSLLQSVAPYSGQIIVIEPNPKLIQYYLDKRDYLYNPSLCQFSIMPFDMHTIDKLNWYHITEHVPFISYVNYDVVYRDEIAFLKQSLCKSL